MVQDAEIAGGAVATDTGLAPIPDESAEQEQPMESGDLTSISPDNPHKGEGAIDDDEEQALFNEAVTSAPVVIFSKTWCPFCTEIKKLLLTYNDNGETKVVVAIELDRQKNGHGLMNAVESVVGRRSVPQVFIGGEYFGGLRAVQHARDEGKLKSIIADAVEAFRKVVVDRDDPKPLDSAAHHAA
ncbi:Glutaredoxin domain-containing protein [Plasmodiophora brassicae]|uniref:Glutaredoxin domain-containing protein n=1 Tax=Plasmodiophora brassicae TaxID=37360 RepID=A0A0G4IGV6_PLABS|nr:hypothetical protein PBRA_000087 [Plasmodiophora brassicae]